jgi:hypothetical protein
MDCDMGLSIGERPEAHHIISKPCHNISKHWESSGNLTKQVCNRKIYFAPWKLDYGLLDYLQIQLKDHGMVSHALNMLNNDIWD